MSPTMASSILRSTSACDCESLPCAAVRVITRSALSRLIPMTSEATAVPNDSVSASSAAGR